jgi:hypothetical protein
MSEVEVTGMVRRGDVPAGAARVSTAETTKRSLKRMARSSRTSLPSSRGERNVR